jgi:hypothetical protein
MEKSRLEIIRERAEREGKIEVITGEKFLALMAELNEGMETFRLEQFKKAVESEKELANVYFNA